MRTRFVAVLANLALLVLVAGCATAPRGSGPGGVRGISDRRIVGYYAGWGVRRGALVRDIDAGRLTHVNYAFANISEDGRAVLGNACNDVGECGAERPAGMSEGGNFAELRALKQRYPHLRTLIAIGGWSWSGRFSDVAATPEARERFVASTLDLFMRRHPGVFDGVDIDWEYPVRGGLAENRYRPEDRRNLTLLLEEFRRQLDALWADTGQRALLTIATPAGQSLMANFEMEEIARVVDWINVMTYDYHTGGKATHFNAPLFSPRNEPTPTLNIEATVQAYVELGVPRDRIVLGVPFFARGFGGVPPEDNGLFQPAAGAPEGTWGAAGGRYAALKDYDERGFERFWHPEAKVPWLYNRETRVWISYDDAESLGVKADHVRRHGLGGVMIWELGGDHEGELLKTLHRWLNR